MPIYEYQCQTCGTNFEKRQSFSEEPRADCPNGHPQARRLLSTPAIVFKGSGFYINDSKANKSSVNGTTNKNGSNGTNGTTPKSDDNGTSSKKDTSQKKVESKAASSEKSKV